MRLECEECGYMIKNIDDAAVHVLTCPMTKQMVEWDNR